MSDIRITRRLNNNIIEFVDGKGYGNLSHSEGVKLLFERLAAYEDTKLSPEEILSLITTIESQQITIETLNSDKSNLHRLYLKHMEESTKRKLEIESQKEEIEKWKAESKSFRDHRNELVIANTQLLGRAMQAESKIESLKAITELAVTCLQRIDSIRESYPASFQHHHVDAAFIKAERLTTEALEEIERLQNG